MAGPVVRYEVREVLAAAYLPGSHQPETRRRAKMHTHTVAIADDGTETPICTRVRADSLADAGSMSAGDRDKMPTCPACQARLRALAREALRG